MKTAGRVLIAGFAILIGIYPILYFLLDMSQGFPSTKSAATVALRSWQVAFSTLTHDFIDAYYIKAPELGHYLEYVRPFDAGNQFYNSLPVS